MQVRDENENVIGTFEEGVDYKLMKCHHVIGNSITHKNSHYKQEIVAQWNNQGGLTNLIIKAVVVFDYKHAQELEENVILDYPQVIQIY